MLIFHVLSKLEVSKIENKSMISLQAAELLHNKQLYSSVAHCAYYSCFQLMKHLWLYKMNKTDNDLRILNQQKNEAGSHDILINEIQRFVKNRSVQESRLFTSKIAELKKLRTKADYNDEEIYSNQSTEAISYSKNIISILNKFK